LLVALLALALPGAVGADPPQPGLVHVRVPPGTSPREHGLQLYAANCLSCHGDRTKAPSLRGVGALAADFELRTGYMPLHALGEQPRRSRVLFSERELDALVVYIASLGKGPPIPKPHPERGNLSEGLRLFTENCAGCHQVVAEGGYLTGAIAPPLKNASATQIAEAVRLGPYVMPSFPPSLISDRQLDSIARYVLQTRHPTDRGGWSIGHLGPVPEGMATWLLAAAVLVATCLVIGRRLRRE
jgi:ubiquinol-cytochrome c reductase cytochrome c subunit